MFRNTYDWGVKNRSWFGELGLTFAVTFLWVMLVIFALNVAAFSGASFDLGATILSVISATPKVLAGYLPQLTAESGMGSLFLYALTVCVIAPLVEEMFRSALLQGFCEERHTGKMKNPFLILAMSFIFFGMLHGGYLNILIQGVLGLMLARLWFKVGRSNARKYFSMVAIHGAYNFCMVGIQLMVLRSLG